MRTRVKPAERAYLKLIKNAKRSLRLNPPSGFKSANAQFVVGSEQLIEL